MVNEHADNPVTGHIIESIKKKKFLISEGTLK